MAHVEDITANAEEGKERVQNKKKGWLVGESEEHADAASERKTNVHHSSSSSSGMPYSHKSVASVPSHCEFVSISVAGRPP